MAWDSLPLEFTAISVESLNALPKYPSSWMTMEFDETWEANAASESPLLAFPFPPRTARIFPLSSMATATCLSFLDSLFFFFWFFPSLEHWHRCDQHRLFPIIPNFPVISPKPEAFSSIDIPFTRILLSDVRPDEREHHLKAWKTCALFEQALTWTNSESFLFLMKRIYDIPCSTISGDYVPFRSSLCWWVAKRTFINGPHSHVATIKKAYIGILSGIIKQH